MLRAALALAGLGLSLAITPPVMAQADNYPNKPINVIVTFPPGGSTDTVMRLLGPEVAKELGQPLIIENRPGAGGHIGMSALADAKPDGYTIGVGAAGAMAINRMFYPEQNFEALEELAPFTYLADIPFVWLAREDLPVDSVGELVEWVKAGNLVSAGHGGNGSAMHLSIALLNEMEDIDLNIIAYKGSGPAATDTAGGQVDVSVVDIPSALPHVQSNRAKIIGVTTAERLADRPDLPTVNESVDDYVSTGWFGMVAPAGTPQPILEKLHAAFEKVLTNPEILERGYDLGVYLKPMTPEEYTQFIRDETDKWEAVIEATGARPS